MDEVPSKLGIGWQSVPVANVSHAWLAQDVPVEFSVHLHDELVVQASLSLVASAHAVNVLQVPLTLSVPFGVKAQTVDLLFSKPPPLQAVIVL